MVLMSNSSSALELLQEDLGPTLLLLQPLSQRDIEGTIHHELDVHER